MSIIRSATVCILLLLPMVQPQALAGEQETLIEVVYSDGFPLTGRESLLQRGIEVKTYNLDDGKRLTSSLASGLPRNQNRAKAALEQRFKREGAESVRNRFAMAFHGMVLGMRYGLSRYPAVVFDHGRAVVYGVTDLPHALSLYQDWRRNHP